MPNIRVVVADNHPAMLAHICQQLSNNYEVVRTAQDGLEACKAVLELQPDIVLLDITMPIMDGLYAAQRLRQAKCRVRIILLSASDDPDFIAATFSAGADCYVAKSRLSTDLDPAIRAALQGSHYFSHSDGFVELPNRKL